MYSAGEGVEKNKEEALRFYLRAAKHGYSKGMLLEGRSTTQDEYREARNRCEKAAERYSPGAYCTSVIYKRGLGVAADPMESVKWLNRAADAGNAKSILDLARAFCRGNGVHPDLVTAYMWAWIALDSKVPGSEQLERCDAPADEFERNLAREKTSLGEVTETPFFGAASPYPRRFAHAELGNGRNTFATYLQTG